MVTVVKISWPKMGINYGWMFALSSEKELTDYWKKSRSLQVREGFVDFIHSREYEYLNPSPKGKRIGDHLHTHHAALLNMACTVEAMKPEPRSAVEVFCEVYDNIFYSMLKYIQEQGTIYVNPKGAYFHLGPGMEIVATKKMKEYVIPGETITIKKWPNGLHFYAYVGGATVFHQGRNKWPTEGSARTHAEQWAKENNISIEESE